jgi:LmbE family N-acetylglucosaminyl deacetylase
VNRVRKNIRGRLPQHFNTVMLSPHSDDIALSLGAFLLGMPSALHINIITAFSISECTADDSIKDSAVVSSIRKAEDVDFANSLGRHIEVRWLDRQDAPLRLHIPDEAVFSSKPSYMSWNEVQYLTDKMKEEYNNFDLLFAPMGLGKHIDHIVVRNAALELLKDGFPLVFYEDIPYAADLSLTDIDEYAKQLEDISGQNLELFHIKTGVTIEKKLALLSCYRSQMDSRTESRVRSHANRNAGNSIVERVWASTNSLSDIKLILEGGNP